MANNTYKRNQPVCEPPDIKNMKEVVIDFRTKIYIAKDADPEEARERYLNRLDRTKK